MSSISMAEATTMVRHGGYAQPSRYQITQHRYGAGGNPGYGGFIELLEIADPPSGSSGVVIHERLENGPEITEWFIEWRDLPSARAAAKVGWSMAGKRERLCAQPGFKRLVLCDARIPWFYAIGDQKLDGNFVKED